LGWAGPTNWARLSPKMCWAGKSLVFLFWARPGPEGRAGPGSAWPINKTSWARTSLAQHKKLTGGIIFPHPPACRTNVPHAEGNAGDKSKMRGKESLPGAEEAVALVLVLLEAEAGGVAATFFLLPAVSALLLLFVSFAPSVNNVLLSLQWRRGGAGAAGGCWRCLGSRTAAPSSGGGATFFSAFP